MFRLGKTVIAIKHRYGFRTPIPPDHYNHIEEALSVLHDLLEGFDWALVGGTPLDLLNGKLTRFHHDLDLEINLAQRTLLTTVLLNKNYRVYRKKGSSNIWKGRIERLFRTLPDSYSKKRVVYLYREAEISGNLDRNDSLWMVNPSMKNPLLREVNLFFKDVSGDKYSIRKRGRVFEFSEPYLDSRALVIKKRRIPVRNLQVQLALKTNQNLYSDKIKHDISVLQDMLNKS